MVSVPFRLVSLHAIAGLAVTVCALSSFAAPVAFEQNRGQSAGEVRFLARGDGYVLFLTPGSAVMKLRAGDGRAEDVVTMKLAGRAGDAEPRGERRTAARTSYFRGDPSQWRADVPLYEAVRYPGVYRGIDLLYYGAGDAVEYDFEVQPGARPRDIRLRFEGARAIAVSPEGDLVLQTASGEVRQQRPYAYQVVNGSKRAVAAEYALRAHNEVSFRLGRYDRNLPLVIDPVVRYATYLGGGREDTVLATVADFNGSAYVAGCTQSADFPGAPGAPSGGVDAFVMKLDPTGANVVYTAFVGGSRNECVADLALTGDGSVYLTGYTASPDFPVRNAAQPQLGGSFDAFVAMLDAAGTSIRYSTFLGGSSFENDPQVGPIGSIAVRPDGTALVTGHTASPDFPATSAAAQRTHGGSIDGFVAHVDPSRNGAESLRYATFIGGGSYDVGAGIATGTNGAAFVAGTTRSTDLPVTANAFQRQYNARGDAFIAKLSPGGDAFVYSSYAGGENYDSAAGLVADDRGIAHLAAYTTSIDYPTVAPLQTAHGGFFRSTDSGLTWTKSNSGLRSSVIRALAVDPVRTERVYAATDRGIYRSVDAGGTWQAANHGLPLDEAGDLNVHDVDVDSAGQQIFASTARGLFRSTDGGDTWQRRDSGLPFGAQSDSPFVVTTAVDPRTPSTLYTAVVAPQDGLVWKSTDSGQTWTAIDRSTPRGRLTVFGRALAVDPRQPSTIYAGSFGAIYRSDDGGSTWAELANGLPNISVYDIVVAPTDSSIVYAATITDVFKSSDRGATWRRASTGLGDGIVTGLAVDGNDPSTLYLNKAGNAIARIIGASAEAASTHEPEIVNGGVFKTTDGGQSWVPLTTGFESNGGGGIVIQPNNSAVVFATAAVVGDVGITTVSVDGSTALFSTYFGGRDRDLPSAIELGCGSRLFFGGSTMSDDYPLLRPVQSERRGHLFPDAFVTEITLAENPQVKFSTFAGSPDEEEDLRDLSADCDGNVLLAGMTYSRRFPTASALQPFHGGGRVDGFLMKMNVDPQVDTTRRRSVRR